MRKLQEVEKNIGKINQQIQKLVEKREDLVHEYVDLSKKEGKPLEYKQEEREEKLLTCSGCQSSFSKILPKGLNPDLEFYCSTCQDKGIDAYEHGDDIMFAYPKNSKIREWKDREKQFT